MNEMLIPSIFIAFLMILAAIPLFRKEKKEWCAEQLRDYRRIKRWSVGALIALVVLYAFLWFAVEDRLNF